VFLFAHEGCGFYRARCGRLPDAEIRRMQIEHLHAAHTALKRQHADLAVTTCYASTAEGAIVFTDVTRAPGS
jgi:hypothetical protein